VNPKGRYYLEDLGIDRRIKLYLGGTEWEVVDWFHVAQNTVMNIWVP